MATAPTQVTGRESGIETGMRGSGRVQERGERGGTSSAEGMRDGCDMTENQTACLRSSSPTTQSGFEVRFYLVPLTLPSLTQFCTTHCATKHSQTHRSTRSCLFWGKKHNRSIECFLPWPICKPHKLKMTCAWLSKSGRRKHKRSVLSSSSLPPLPPPSHMLTHLHSSPRTLSHE